MRRDRLLRRRRPRPRPRPGLRRGTGVLRPAPGGQGALGHGRRQRLRRDRVAAGRGQGDARHRPAGLRPVAGGRRVPGRGRGVLGRGPRRGGDGAALDRCRARPRCRLLRRRGCGTRSASCGCCATRPAPRSGDAVTGQHTDYGAITLLATDGVPGLEVRPRGGTGWLAVEAPPGSLVVNLGDMLARWTNDRYVSTPHRVVATGAGERISIPFFVNPDPETEVACLPSCVDAAHPCRYEPITAGRLPARPDRRHDPPRRRPLALTAAGRIRVFRASECFLRGPPHEALGCRRRQAVRSRPGGR